MPTWTNHTPSISMEEDERWLAWAEQQFVTMAGADRQICLEDFKKALNLKRSFFAERFFSLFDQDGSGTIELPELLEGLHMLTKGDRRQKLKFLFDVYDVDGSGTIDPSELKTVLRSCMEESSLQISEESLESLTMALFNSADHDKSGSITYEELVAELEKHPGIVDNLTISAANWLKPPGNTKKSGSVWPRYLTRKYIKNNVRKVMFVVVFFLINVGLFTLSAIRYKDTNPWVIVARGCGMDLNFNSAFIVVLMLRFCLTWLRTTWLAQFLPLDQSIAFHKMVGIVIFFQSVVHTVCHLGNIFEVLKANATDNATIYLQSLEYWEFLFTLRSGIGYVGPGFGYLSGVILLVVLTIMVLCSMSCVRRSGHFQLFYWTHMLYVVYWVMLILHGPLFWMFFIGPGAIFLLEFFNKSKLFRLAKFGKTYISEVNLLPSKVTHLVITRPDGLKYKPGDYVFLQIPAIAQYEWHPFTISSAPEMPDTLWLHVRSVGHWTNKLWEYFQDYQEPPARKNVKNGLKDVNIAMKGTFGHVNKSYIVDIPSGTDGDVVEITTFKQSGPNTSTDSATSQMSNVPLAPHALHDPCAQGRHKRAHVRVYMDGPYGTQSREIFDAEHAVLISSGIGVTPFAAILQSIAHRYHNCKRKCPRCQHMWYGEVPEDVMKLNKVDFIWINRDQKAFEWFVSILAGLELEQEHMQERFLDMHMYMTAALNRNDMKALGLQMALEILHQSEGKDVITGLRTRTQPGRPNWDEVFSKIATERKGKVKVFFCGSPELGKVLKKKCVEYKFGFSKENF